MGWLASLFGGGKTTEKLVDGLISGTDALVFTDEEKSVAQQKILDWKLDWVKNTQGQNISRRVIAIAVTFMWVLCCILILAAKAFGADAFSEFAFKFMTDVVVTPFSIVMGFYFLAHVVRGATGK